MSFSHFLKYGETRKVVYLSLIMQSNQKTSTFSVFCKIRDISNLNTNSVTLLEQLSMKKAILQKSPGIYLESGWFEIRNPSEFCKKAEKFISLKFEAVSNVIWDDFWCV